MAGSKAVFDVPIIFGLLVGIANEHGHWGTCGFSLENAGENFDFVSFVSGGGDCALSGTASVHF